jgi:hypothetical protein
VVEQVARAVDAETFAYAPVGIPHDDRYPYGPGRRSLCHGSPSCSLLCVLSADRTQDIA